MPLTATAGRLALNTESPTVICLRNYSSGVTPACSFTGGWRLCEPGDKGAAGCSCRASGQHCSSCRAEAVQIRCSGCPSAWGPPPGSLAGASGVCSGALPACAAVPAPCPAPLLPGVPLLLRMGKSSCVFVRPLGSYSQAYGAADVHPANTYAGGMIADVNRDHVWWPLLQKVVVAERISKDSEPVHLYLSGDHRAALKDDKCLKILLCACRVGYRAFQKCRPSVCKRWRHAKRSFTLGVPSRGRPQQLPSSLRRMGRLQIL